MNTTENIEPKELLRIIREQIAANHEHLARCSGTKYDTPEMRSYNVGANDSLTELAVKLGIVDNFKDVVPNDGLESSGGSVK
jgi:hypothetical protein